MLKKIFTLFLLLLLSTNVFAESIKDYVCIVKGNFSAENEKFLTQYKDELAKSGYGRYSEYIEGFLKGTFGSGFVYYSKNGTPFILTNRHVVSEYETVNIYFENDDGSTSEFKNLKIVATDEDIDIAMIGLPEGFNKKGLEFISNPLNDGDDVWSAGFPGLGSEPMWQLGKGIVSNSKAKIKELLDPSISTLIQHTAEVDGGNSGGPLLIKNPKTSLGYSVVGINTWKAYYRQNTNYAIPANAIEKFVENNVSGIGTIEIKNRINSFVKAISNDENFDNLSRFISNKMVAEIGQEVFKKTLSIAPENVRSTAIDSFAYNPLEGMRYSLAYWIWTEFRQDEKFETPIIGEITENAEIYSLEFNPEEKSSVSSQWIKENGQWKLSEFNGSFTSKKTSPSKSKKSKGTFNIEQVGTFEISGGYLSSLNLDRNGFDVQLAVTLEYFRLGFFLQNQTIPYEKESINMEEKASSIGFLIGGQIPMLIGSFIVEPFAYARAGFVNFFKFTESDINILVAGFSGGINLGYEVSTEFSPFLTVKYNYLPFKIKEGFSDYTQLKNHELSIGLGFKF